LVERTRKESKTKTKRKGEVERKGFFVTALCGKKLALRDKSLEQKKSASVMQKVRGCDRKGASSPTEKPGS